MSSQDLLKKARVIQRLLGDIEHFYTQFKAPMPMKVVSARFAKQLDRLGGFHETLKELELDGSISIMHERGGKRLIYPQTLARKQPKAVG